MLWLLSILVIGIITYLVAEYDRVTCAIAGGLFFGGLAIVFGSLLCLLLPSRDFQTHDTFSLENIHDGTSVHGSFFLGIGNVDSSPSFYFYLNDNGAYKLYNVDSGYATVYQDTSSPRVEYYYKHCVTNKLWTVFPKPCGQDGYDHVVFHVPPGSIVKDYTLGGKAP